MFFFSLFYFLFILVAINGVSKRRVLLLPAPLSIHFLEPRDVLNNVILMKHVTVSHSGNFVSVLKRQVECCCHCAQRRCDLFYPRAVSRRATRVLCDAHAQLGYELLPGGVRRQRHVVAARHQSPEERDMRECMRMGCGWDGVMLKLNYSNIIMGGAGGAGARTMGLMLKL